jgi:hypothetical protein
MSARKKRARISIVIEGYVDLKAPPKEIRETLSALETALWPNVTAKIVMEPEPSRPRAPRSPRKNAPDNQQRA